MDESAESTDVSHPNQGFQEHQKLPRADNYQRLIISVLILTFVAWILGKQDVSIIWIFFLLVWIYFWWQNTASNVIELAAKEAEIDERRKKAFTNYETVEWLNFLLNRWFVFSDRSLLHVIKKSLDPILERQRPSFIGLKPPHDPNVKTLSKEWTYCMVCRIPSRLKCSIEVRDFTLGNRTPYFKHVTVYDTFDDQRKIKASEINFNHPPEDLMTRGKYKVVIHLEAGLTSPEARFIIRIKLANKGFLAQTCTDVAIEDLQISGKLQLELLLNQNIPFPHLAAISVCFTEEPNVSFNIRLLKAVQLMEFPLIRQWIKQMVNDHLKLALMDPGGITIPLCDDPEVVGRSEAYARGVLTLSINGGSHGKLSDDPFWSTVKIGSQKRHTREVLGDTVWRDHVSLLVYNLHADKLIIKLKARRKLGTTYTIAEHVLSLSTLCLESNPQQEKLIEKSFRPATLLVQMEYTSLSVIQVTNKMTAEDFERSYSSRLRKLYPQEVSGVLLICVHGGQNLVPMAKNGLSDPYCVIYENSRMVKKGESVKATLSPVWDTMVEILVADFTQTTLSFVVLDKDTNAIKIRKDGREDFMGSCNLSLTQSSPVFFKKDLDLLYKVRGSGMMKAGTLCVSAIFRPVCSAIKSEIHENSRGLPEGEPPGQKDAKMELQTLEALLRAGRGTIEVNIYQGRNLVAKDVNGKSDPFVTIKEGTGGREKFRTRVIFNTLNPVWNDTALAAMPNMNGLLLLEVWDKDPISQERMGQVVFTTEKLKDLGKAPYEKQWFRLRGVKTGEIQLSFKYTPSQANDDDFNSNLKSGQGLQLTEDPASTATSHSFPSSYGPVLPKPKKGVGKRRGVSSWGDPTQVLNGTRGTIQEQSGDVFTQTFAGSSFTRVENQDYKLKAWPQRKSRRLRSVADTVRYFRCGVGSDFAPTNPGAENFEEGEETSNETNSKEFKGKFKSPLVNSKWRKFGFLRDRRQRSASESRLSELYAPSDEMDPASWRTCNVRRRSKSGPKGAVRRILSATVTGAMDFNRRRSFQNVFQSLPNSPSSTVMNRNHHRNNSRSSTSHSTNSQGSTPTSNDSCSTCNLDLSTETQNSGQLLSTAHASISY